MVGESRSPEVVSVGRCCVHFHGACGSLPRRVPDGQIVPGAPTSSALCRTMLGYLAHALNLFATAIGTA